MAPIRSLTFSAAPLVTLMLAVPTAHAQPGELTDPHVPSVQATPPRDGTADALARARIDYEAAMEGVRKRVLEALKGSTKRESERASFEENGTWPTVPKVEEYQSQAARAASDLRSAYKKTVELYKKKGNDTLRSAVQQEWDQWESQSDIAPWGENRVERQSDGRTLKPDKPLVVEMPTRAEYRVEVTARRTSDSGTLNITLPLGAQRITAPASVGADGKVRAILSVSADAVSADLGVERPIDLRKTLPSTGTGIVLQADRGAFDVESVRVKRIVAGKPATLAKAPAPNKTSHTVDLTETFPAGYKFAGGTLFDDRGNKTYAVQSAVIEKHADGELRLKVDTEGSKPHVWTFSIAQSGAISLESRSNRRGERAIKNIHVSGTLTAQGLDISGNWDAQGRRGGAGHDLRLHLDAR